MNKFYAVFLVARQIGGEYIFIRSEKAFTTPEKATNHLENLKSQYVKDDKNVPVKLMTPNGEVECLCEIGVFDIIIEE